VAGGVRGAGASPSGGPTAPTLPVTHFPAPARWTNRGTREEIPWAGLARTLAAPELWPASEGISTSEEQLPGWTFAEFRDDARIAGRDLEASERESAERVVAVRGLVVEYVDEPAADPDHLRAWWAGYGFVAYTSAFHEQPSGARPPGPRWRLLVPFSRPVTRDEAVQLGRWARHPRRGAGIVDAASEAPWRVVAVPAINPGRYRSATQAGAAIDPDAALQALREWEVADRRDAAASVLAETSMADAVVDLVELATHPPRSAAWPWPRLQELAGPLLPGRSVLVSTADPRLRAALLLATATAAHASGAEVLVGTTSEARVELVARLLATKTSVPASDLLAGHCSPEAVAIAAGWLRESFPHLHLWAPGRGRRSLEQLEVEARALVNLSPDARPPFLLLDPVEGWDEGHAAIEGRRAFAAAVTDLARIDGLGPGWPGALVVAGSAAPDPVLATAEGLAAAWRRDPGGLATRLAADGAELDLASHVVLAAAADPIGAVRRVVVAVVRSVDGAAGLVELEWDVATGRLR
jgi:hypothetical protein